MSEGPGSSSGSNTGDFRVGVTAQQTSEGDTGTLPATSSGPQSQNTDLVNHVFSLFKGYLTSQLDVQGKQFQSK
jgi:hypothetical protein